MKLEATSNYVPGFVPVIGQLIKQSPHWESYKTALLHGATVSLWGRKYRMVKRSLE